MDRTIFSFLFCSAAIKESSWSASVIFISATRVIFRIFKSPLITATCTSFKLFGELSEGTRRLRTSPWTSLESRWLPCPVLCIPKFSVDTSEAFGRKMRKASDKIGAKCAASTLFPVMDVVAILERSSSLILRDLAFTTEEAIASDLRYPSTTVSGCRPLDSSRAASSRSAPQMSIVAVTPSPLISSCVLPIETIILAAGCLTKSSDTILAPSFVTAILPSVLYSILSRPRGPKVGRRISENTLAAAIIFSWTSVPFVIFV